VSGAAGLVELTGGFGQLAELGTIQNGDFFTDNT
jgi:hypothetical protein